MGQVKHLVSASMLLVGLVLFWTGGKLLLTTELISPRPSGVVTDYVGTCGNGLSNSEANPLGKVLFSNNCQTCHALDKVLTGPALRGVTKRGPWTDRANLVKWVHNPSAMVKKNDYVKNLVKEYGGQIMPSYPQLSDEEINAIFDYIEGSSGVMY